MSDTILDTTAFTQLSAEQKSLLDTIDSLRSLGLGRIISLPQLIVVGDQSSGKSSVLEAISRVRFPAKAGCCTRFATELVLRTDAISRIHVKIQPAPDNHHSAETLEKLNSFKETSLEKDELPEIMERAKDCMGIREGTTTSFSEDVLRIEISGPDISSLTLVDLPGFFHAETSDQSQEGKAIVDRLVAGYMSQSNSIILAVVSARNELANQKVLAEAKRYDPKRERTLGIITKPDTLLSGSLDERKYTQVAKNQESAHILKLQWHVLKNRGENEGNISHDERDAKEAEFFRASIWSSVLSRDRGAEQLRKKLSRVQFNHIKGSLPAVIQQIQSALSIKEDEVQRLGKPRSTPEDHRDYLSGIAKQFEALAAAAVRGDYIDTFFGGLKPRLSTESVAKVRKLRAYLRNLNHAFAFTLAEKGVSRVIEADGTAEPKDDKPEPSEHLKEYLKFYEFFEKPDVVSLEDLNAELCIHASENQGTEFPGSANHKLAQLLFREQAEPWEQMANHHVVLVTDTAKDFVEQLLEHIVDCDLTTQSALLSRWVDPFFEAMTEELRKKLEELIKPYKFGFQLALEDEYLERLRDRDYRRLDGQVRHFMETHNQPLPEGATFEGITISTAEFMKAKPNEFATEEIIDMAMTYYDMSLRTFTDNVIVLAIENCLVCNVPNILTQEKVNRMDDETLAALASESEEVQLTRDDFNREIKLLKAGLRECQRSRPREPSGRALIRIARSPNPSRTVPIITSDQAEEQPSANTSFSSSTSSYLSSDWDDRTRSSVSSTSTRPPRPYRMTKASVEEE